MFLKKIKSLGNSLLFRLTILFTLGFTLLDSFGPDQTNAAGTVEPLLDGSGDLLLKPGITSKRP